MQSSSIVVHRSVHWVRIRLDKYRVPISLVAKELLVVTHAALIEASISRVLVYAKIIHASTAECNLVLRDIDYGGIAWISGVCLCNSDRGKVIFHVFCSCWLEGLQSGSERCCVVNPEKYEILGFLLKYISGYLWMLERRAN